MKLLNKNYLISFLLFSLISMANAEITTENKGFNVVPTEEKMGIRVPVQLEDKNLHVTITPNKEQYKFDEPVFFTIQGNKPFYLYVYSHNPKNNVHTLLIPSNQQPNNKYPGNNQKIRVPNKGLEFFTDYHGIHHLFFIASVKNLDDKIYKSSALKSLGDLTPQILDNPNQIFETAVLETYQEKMDIRTPSQPIQDGITTQEFEFNVQ